VAAAYGSSRRLAARPTSWTADGELTPTGKGRR
jgi:hypothetical protein